MPDPFSPAALPFSEAIAYWRGKVRLPSSGWTDIWQEQHSHAFVVTGASHDAILEDLYNALDKARSKGGYEAFKAAFPEIAKKHGWAHNGSPGWRSRIIYDTNIRQSYNAGRYQQRMAARRLRPYWRYRHSGSEHPRLEHKAWDGLILPADDPWWDTHEPQNGWGCGCSVESLSRLEAELAGGPNTAPPIDWEEKIVGKNSGNPRVVRTPKGIDPGFAYSPGKAWLEPHTVPPLTGYDAVLKERAAAWPTGFTPPPAPTPTKIPANAILPANTPPEQAVADFLNIFGATMDKGALFTDAAGSPLAISKALFIQGEDKTGDKFKWLATPGKAKRIQHINLLAMTLADPDEIWWAWEKSRDNPGKWLLKRRYLKAFEIEGNALNEYGIVVFEWGRTGWSGSTAFLPTRKANPGRGRYFDKQRIGRIVFKK
ncbi:MAG: hypothetical protein LBF93_06780 [Zoogloeaceae bacterium]|jgi:hypothetical protein|nr:hypothetical protein [Zoogloeaceae bacterium]